MNDGFEIYEEGVVLIIAGHAVSVKMTPPEMRHMAVALAAAADRAEGKQPSPEALAILEPVKGSA